MHTPFESFVVDSVIDGLAVLPFLICIGVLAYLYRRRCPIGNEIRATLWAIAISYVLAHVNRWLGWWPAYPNFPSGHMTFASCVWTELTLIDRRYIFAGIPGLGLLAYALYHSAWHGRVDLAGGFALGVLVMIALRRLWKA